MLPSPRLIIMVLLAAPLLLGGAVFDPFLGAGVLYLIALGAYCLLDALLLPRRKALEIERILPDRFSHDEPGEVQIRLCNHTRRTLRVGLAEDAPPELEIQPEECSAEVAPGSSATVTYTLRGRKRGRYELSALHVRALPRWGLLYRQFVHSETGEVHVYPNLRNVKRYELLIRRGQELELGPARVRRVGQGGEFESLRPYDEGDSLSRIDWKATARRGELIVRNYEAERQQRILVALDLGRAMAGEFDGTSRLDYMVDAALMLAYASLRQGDWFSLVAFSDRVERYLPPVRRLASLDRVSKTLYELRPKLVESDYDAAFRFLGQKHRKRSLICVMSDVLDRESSSVLISHMLRYAHRHLPLIVTLANPQVRRFAATPLSEAQDPYARAVALDLEERREEALQAMRQGGVSVLDTRPGALTPALIDRYLQIKSRRRL